MNGTNRYGPRAKGTALGLQFLIKGGACSDGYERQGPLNRGRFEAELAAKQKEMIPLVKRTK